MIIYIILILILILILIYFIIKSPSFCIKTHSQNYEDYPWLNILNHGKVIKVEFQEPIGGKWTLYDDHWWKIHCKVINHSKNLYESHVNAFINPNTRFAKLRFYFEDKTIMEPTPEFYKLEDDYFKLNN